MKNRKFLILIFSIIFVLFLYPDDQAIPDTYFGLHIHRFDTKPWPNVPFKSWRLWDAGICWPEIEPNKGEWHFEKLDRACELAALHNVEIDLNLGLSPRWAAARPNNKSGYGDNLTASEPKNIEDWKNYVRVLAERYKGKIKYWEIWNEPDIFLFYTGSVEKMVELTKEAYIILKKTDPENKIISPPVTGYTFLLPWLNRFLKAGGKNYIDIVGTHFYVWFKTDNPENVEKTAALIKKYMKENNMKNIPIWNTEGGLKQHDLNQAQMSSYLARLYIIQWSIGIERYFVYSWNNKFFIQMSANDEDPKTLNDVGRTYIEIQKWLIGKKIKNIEKKSGDIRIARLTSPDNGNAVIVWHSNLALAKKIKYKIRNSIEADGIGPSPVMINLAGETLKIPDDGAIEVGSSPVLICDEKFIQ